MKIEKTVVHQNVTAIPSDGEATIPDAGDTSGATRPAPKVQVFDHLLDESQSALAITIVPAELISLHALDLPVRSTRQQRDALPFALEDKVARSLDETHFALLGTTGDGKTLAAALAHTTMRTYLDDTPEVIVVPEQVLLNTPEPDDSGGVTWAVCRRGPRVLVRASDGTGFALQADMLAPLWDQAGKPEITAYGDPLADDVTADHRTDVPIMAREALARFDLRQGTYRPARGLAAPLRGLAAIVALAGLAHLAIAAADVYAQRQIADDLRLDAARALDVALPGATPDDPPGVVQRQIVAQNQPQRGSGFLPLLTRASTALLDGEAAVQFRQLSWSDDTLRLTVEAADLETLQQAEAALSAQGMAVASGSATADGGAARAELTVRP